MRALIRAWGHGLRRKTKSWMQIVIFFSNIVCIEKKLKKFALQIVVNFQNIIRGGGVILWLARGAELGWYGSANFLFVTNEKCFATGGPRSYS